MADQSIGKMAIVLGVNTAPMAAGFQFAIGKVNSFAASAVRATSALSAANEGTMAGMASASLLAAGSFGAVGLAIGAVGVAIRSGFSSLGERGHGLAAMSRDLGVTAEEAAGLRYAFQLTGTSAEDAGPAMARLNRNFAEARGGSQRATSSFVAAGISIERLRDPAVGFNDILGDVSESYLRMDAASRQAMGFSLAGRSFHTLMPVLRQGREGLRAIAEEAALLGGEHSPADMARAISAQRSMGAASARFGLLGESLRETLAVSAAAPLEDAANRFSALMIQHGPAIRNALGLAMEVVVEGVVKMVEGFAWILERANEIGTRATPGALNVGADAIQGQGPWWLRAALPLIPLAGAIHRTQIGGEQADIMAQELRRGANEAPAANQANRFQEILTRLRATNNIVSGGADAFRRANAEAVTAVEGIRSQQVALSGAAEAAKIFQLQRQGADAEAINALREQLELLERQKRTLEDIGAATKIKTDNEHENVFASAFNAISEIRRLQNLSMLGGDDASLGAFRASHGMLALGREAMGITGPQSYLQGSQQAISTINRFQREGNRDVASILEAGQRIAEDQRLAQIQIGRETLEWMQNNFQLAPVE